MSHYGLAHTWQQGDIAMHMMALGLLSMFILSWTIIIIKSCDLWRTAQLAKQVEKTDLSSLFIEEKLKPLNTINASPFLVLAHAAQVAVDHYRNQPPKQQHPDLNEWLTHCLTQARNDSVLQLQRGLRILALIASSAPFIGLLGTVIGLYQTLLTSDAPRLTTLEQLTESLGDALMMMIGSLSVAIPALLFYKLFTSANKTIIHQLNRYAHRLHVYFLASHRFLPVP